MLLREREETRELYEWVHAREDGVPQMQMRLGQRLLDACLDVLPDDLMSPVGKVLAEIFRYERYLWPTPPPHLEAMTLKEFTEYRALLFQKQYVLRNLAAVEDMLFTALEGTFLPICADLPQTLSPSPFTVPLILALPDPRGAVSSVLAALLASEHRERGLFATLAEQLRANLDRASGRTDANSRKPFIFPKESKLPLIELVDTYLSGTPYHTLFTLTIPLRLTHEDRFNHMHIVGGTGAGKTTLIEWLIAHDLRTSDHPSLVIVDPHGDLISRFTHADLDLHDRIILISPRDVAYPPAINIFAQSPRIRTYDQVVREQVSAGVIQTFDYLFTGLFELDMTGKQQVVFRNLTRLLISFPEAIGRNATILDMLALTREAAPDPDCLRAIRALPPMQRDFFEQDFLPKASAFKQTKEQIRYRLQAVLENPTLARLFTSPETKVDLFEEMNSGKIILIDTAKDFLKDGSSTFGRIMISLVLQAVLERAAIPERERTPVFLIVDEAASYFDSNIDDLLTEARKYKCGLVLAHQYLDQASHALRASLAANTGAKFAAGLSSADARSMAADMRTTPDFILNQPRLQFAAHFRNITPHAVSIPVRPGLFASVPKAPPELYDAFMEFNRAQVSSDAPTPAPPSAEQIPPHLGDEDISQEW